MNFNKIKFKFVILLSEYYISKYCNYKAIMKTHVTSLKQILSYLKHIFFIQLKYFYFQ